MPNQPILILQGPLTGRHYAVTKYQRQGDNLLAKEKHDVTDQIKALQAAAWEEAVDAMGNWYANNPTPAGVPVDPPRNPYE